MVIDAAVPARFRPWPSGQSKPDIGISTIEVTVSLYIIAAMCSIAGLLFPQNLRDK
jgi:hypothetical protein